MPILSLDLGSTNLKAAIFDDHLARLSESALELTYQTWENDRVEIARIANIQNDGVPTSNPDNIAITRAKNEWIGERNLSGRGDRRGGIRLRWRQ